MNIKVLTLFPEMFKGFMDASIIKRAQNNKIINIEYLNIRDFASNKHKKVDDYPYGGGAGMVMTPQPFFDAYKNATKHLNNNVRTIYMSPKGKTFNQKLAIDFSKEENLVILCGHYEGIDQRVIDHLVTDEISIGDYVLTGGELPAAVMIDSITRLLPGVLGKSQSFKDETFYSGLLEYPQYTRPKTFNDISVPKVLLSGNHKEIEYWRKHESLKVTLKRRPDLIRKLRLSKEDQKQIEEIKKYLD
ncbi:tRNA (guanosine(37)-N1)-methyltransferase TrmD [Serpentinicella sp. ANB-PHB4]|uniref:tRNA (guanosine(37)-N1)-methyltransferase TrmD n=1 Tax=Serpentinicella sp. ANB-PHB4 TaxID=3074076 RepID=UPI002855DFDC|nr:tRNA (guanosine(37)-N1)-methyltransferase TrmD [Serpentinicella sp. ANB-PHB4]MDR5658284.1 tRNA (guanosine(37)-N1)-methyltransferase TrmD [Serpentinicella sp. ANB-PHB4]